jgi:hypothetical protein
MLTRYLESLLFRVGRLDLATYVGVAATLVAAGALACWLPARRAMRVDPMTALPLRVDRNGARRKGPTPPPPGSASTQWASSILP